MDTSSLDIINRLNLSGKALSKGQKQIAQYIADHYDKAIFMTAGSLGAECGVSESTVVRFAMSLGYAGYPELRDALSSLVRQRLTTEQRFAIASTIDPENVLTTVLKNDAQNIQKTIEELPQQDFDLAVKQLENANHIYVMGLRSAAPLALFMYHYLHEIREEVILVQNTVGDVYEEIARIGQKDVLVGISFPRYSARTLDCMRFARQNGAQVIALTDGSLSPLKAECDICLTACTNMSSFVDSLAAPLSLINALAVSLSLRRRDALSEHFRKMEAIWNKNSVYIGKSNE